MTKNTWLIFSENVIHLTKGTSEKNKQTKTQGPSTDIRIFLKTEIFSPFYSLLSRRKRCFRAPKTQVFENGPQSEDFFKHRLVVYVWTNENRVYEYDVAIHHTTHALQEALSYLHRFRSFVWMSKNDLNTPQVDAYFLEKGEENPPLLRSLVSR